MPCLELRSGRLFSGEDGVGWEEAAIRQRAREAGSVPGPFRCTGPKAPRSGAGSPPPRSSASNITGSSGLFYFFKQIILLKLILAALGLPCCVRAFSSCSERGLLLVVHRFLIAVASLVEHGLWALDSGVSAPGL